MQELQRNPEMMRQMMAMQYGGAGGAGGAAGGGAGVANLLAQDPEMLTTLMQVRACLWERADSICLNMTPLVIWVGV